MLNGLGEVDLAKPFRELIGDAFKLVGNGRPCAGNPVGDSSDVFGDIDALKPAADFRRGV